jgi:predicted metal-dependent hydrolase
MERRGEESAGATEVNLQMPLAFENGVTLFNEGHFFEAHEVFEELLDDVEEDGRWDLLVALIQVAVGYHKWTSGHAGAARMLGLGLEKLSAFPDLAWGVDVGRLRARLANDRTAAEGATRPTADRPRILLSGRRTSV